MADNIKKVDYKGSAILVEAAIRDQNGYIIDQTYVKYHDLTKNAVGLDKIENKSLDTTVTADSGNYITSGAVKTYVDNNGGKIDSFKLNGTTQTITNKEINLIVDKNTVGLNNVDNTSDINKPISTATQTALDSLDTRLDIIESDYVKISETGNKLDMDNDYKIYLKDKNNNVLSYVDLPLESVVVNGSYSNLTKKVTLTLQNNSTIEFSVANLVDGLISVETFNTHVNNTNNPHSVTKAQVGLGNVENKTLDTTVTENSGNYITSGAVKTYVDNNSSKTNPYKYIKQIDNYLFEVQYPALSNADYTTANSYFKTMPRTSGGGCTGVVKGNRVLRQMDWYYDENAEFIVRTNADKDLGIHASIGVASGVSGLTKEAVESGEYNTKYKMLPFIITDGINDAGLYIQSNVVVGANFDINPSATNECCVTMVNRYILDHCSSFEEVEEFFNTYHIYGTSAVEYNYHFLLVQRGEVNYVSQIKWEVIEITSNGHITVTKGTDENQMPNGIMANFRTSGLIFADNDIDINSVETYGIGVERYQLATKAFTEDDYSLEDLRTELMYSNAYRGNVEGAWRTEFAGYYSGDHKLTVVDAFTEPALYNDVLETEKERFENKTRNDGAEAAWQTVHSCIYDIDDRSFNIVVQENEDNVYKFRLSQDVINDNVDDGENSTYSISKIQSLLYEEYETRNAAIESLNDSIGTEANARAAADTALQTNITNEATARANADTTLQTNITNETTARQTADTTLQTNIDNIDALIPAQASSSNQLADKAFTNSSIQTATANFRGNWNTWSVVPSDGSLYPEDYTGSKIPTVNDYLVVKDASGYTTVGTSITAGQALSGTWRFKYSGTWSSQGKSGWLPEYPLNDTPMTAEQLAALNSGITSTKVSAYDGYATSKQDSLSTGTGIDITNNVISVNDLPTEELAEDLTFTPTTTVGGCQQGTTYSNKSVKQLLEQILCPYVEFKFSSISTTPTATTYEYGAAKTVTKVTPIFTAGSREITSVKIGSTSGGDDLYSGTSATSNSAITLTTSKSLDGLSNVTIYCTLADGNTTTTKQTTFTFNKYNYYAVTNSTTPPTNGTSIGTGTEKDITTTDNTYIWFMCPTQKTQIQQYSMSMWNNLATTAGGTVTFTTSTGQQLTYYTYRTDMMVSSTGRYRIN